MFIIKRIQLLALLLLLTDLSGCSSLTHLVITQKNSLPVKETDTMLAGVGVTDITPPVGLPMNGYSLNGNKSEGVRTKLKARAFYIKPKKGEPLVVVQLDMLSGESLLHHRVAELIAEKTDVKAHNLTLNATHTHSGPGQYHSSNAFNTFASNTGGFNPAYFEQLAQWISQAVITAYNTRRPAKVATGAIDIWGFTRNRSHEPHVANLDVKNKDLAIHRRYTAIDPVMTMVRIDVKADDGQYRPLGAFSTFAIHGTALSSAVSLYSADVWAYISQELEWSIREHYPLDWQPVYGPFQGNHADVAPNTTRKMMGYIEAQKVGKGIAAQAWQLFHSLDTQLKDDITIRTALREVNVLQDRRIDDVELCDRAYFSTAQTAAPDEHETPILYYLPPFRRGWPGKLFTGCHGAKHVMGWEWIQGMIFEPEEFPYLLNVHVAQVDDLMMVSLPFEITVKGGDRIKAKVAEVLASSKAPVRYLTLSSVANGYFGYAVTPEEYALQWYEGGSTIYGPNTIPFLAAQSASLVNQLLSSSTNIANLPERWEQSLKSKDFSLPTEKARAGRVPLSTADFTEAAINQEAYWSFAWKDVPPAYIELNKSLVSVEYKTKGSHWSLLSQNNRPVNDAGYNIAIIYQDETDSENRGLYEVRWYNPEVNPAREYRFVIQPRDNQPVFYSESFRW